ncbi:MAG TPA: tetratricopeptide repeat protein [Chloroflexia bacterium]|nr:tetratricopeptide repeat protein [Chloroflexia bacterium]
MCGNISLEEQADAYSQQGMVTDAINAYTAALSCDPSNVQLYLKRARLYANDSQMRQAIADYTTAIQLQPDLATAYKERGEIYRGRSQYDSAISDLQQATQLQPDEETYIELANAYLALQDHSSAYDAATRAITLAPNDSYAYYLRGLIYDGTGDRAQAISDVQKALAIGLRSDMQYFAEILLKRLQDK